MITEVLRFLRFRIDLPAQQQDSKALCDSTTDSLKHWKALQCKKYEHIEFKKSVTNADFCHSHFLFAKGNKVRFTNCDFRFCYFSDGYFHEAEFKNCRFVGCKFRDCNLRSAKISGCDFSYATFRNTLVPSDQMMRNLPERPNVRQELCCDLRVNASSLGNEADIRRYIDAEMKAQSAKLGAQRRLESVYYRDRFGSFTSRIRVYAKSLVHWIDLKIWGHGEKPVNAALSGVIALLLLGGAHYIVHFPGWPESLALHVDTLKDAILSVLGMALGVSPERVPLSAPLALQGAIYLAKYTILSVLITTLIKRFKRR